MYSSTALSYRDTATVPQLLFESNLNGRNHDYPAIIDGLTGEVIYTYQSFRQSVEKLAIHLRTEFHLDSSSIVCLLAANSVCTLRA